MRYAGRILSGWVVVVFVLTQLQTSPLHACSTFKLQKGDKLLYGHNLNQPGMNVPGLIFINKRGLFKIGRSWSEMITKERSNPSTLTWISRYGSVTFSTFGRDMPDGGINEVGLYIWEMNDETEYPKNDALPKLVQMNWMQYVLDNFSSLDEAVASASEVEIDGWGWHYFLGDGDGRCASVEFIKGRVVVHRGKSMPVPGLFNEPYARELELMRYFKGFGGLYEPALDDPRVPRFVKTAIMIRDYDPSRDAVAYGLTMLDHLKVDEVPKWSVLVDVRRHDIYFKTGLNPEIKKFSMGAFDFSNAGPVLVLNMDRKQGGEVTPLFHPSSDPEIRKFIASLPIPDGFFTQGGTTREEFVERFTTHYHAAEDPGRQHFRGLWKSQAEEGKDGPRGDQLVLDLKVAADGVTGEIRNAKGEVYGLDHIHLLNNHLSFTFRNVKGTIFIAMAMLDRDRMNLELWSTEAFSGSFELTRHRSEAEEPR